jgi:hypothetical protein
MRIDRKKGGDKIKWISTTIKKKYYLEIKKGIKKREYKEYSEYWIKRLEPLIKIQNQEEIGINFLCGRENHKRRVLYIQYINTPWFYDVDGKELYELYIIELGEEIKEVRT